MKVQKEILIKNNIESTGYLKPRLYRLSNSNDKYEFDNLIDANPNIIVFDTLEAQLQEFIKLRSPNIVNFNKKQLQEAIIKHIGNVSLTEYGVWVYYPWSFRLVHILDEEEFIEVRTNRNQNKITKQEQQLLRNKKIGIIGLSVGQSVALSIALERVAGEINIADFDILELSNLNRIRTGIHNLNIPKTVAVAREIAEIDPFIKVNCFHEGISEENIDEFLLKYKKVDLLIDECDEIFIKVLCRRKAKQYQIPVLMDTSDRGMIDVERFDLEPERSIFHGFLEGVDISKIKEAKTDEEKLPYVVPIMGLNTMSTKIKASMLEIEQTISAWPQLASSVVMGGGITCNVARRILLGRYRDSGRYFIDVDGLISDKENDKILRSNILEFTNNVGVENDKPQVSTKEMKLLAKACLSLNHFYSSVSISNEMVSKLISKAILAPTGGNSQSWKWMFLQNQLFLFQNTGEINKFLDFNGYGTVLGLGAATENLLLEARKNGFDAQFKVFPIENNEQLVAQICFKQLSLNSNYNYLVDYIDERCTDRNIYTSESINFEVLEKLKEVCASISGAKLHLLTNSNSIRQYAMILGEIDRILLTTRSSHAGFMKEMRWSEEEVRSTRSGIDFATMDLTASELVGFKMIKNWSVVKYLNKWGGGGAFEKLSRKAAQSSFALGLITVPKVSSNGFFDGGRSLERVWLESTKQNLNFQPMSALTFVFTRLIHGKGVGMDDKMIKMIRQLRKRHEVFFDTNNEAEVFFFRLFKGDKPKKRSLRKFIEDIFILNELKI